MIQLKSLKAQNGDSFLISFVDENSMPKNILIDGGREAAYYDSSSNSHGDLKSEIDAIRARKENIDLLILTHIDNDHICGLLKWFEMDTEAYKLIKKVWFNSGKSIAEFLKKPENKDLEVGLKIFKSAETGVKEALDFEKYLINNNIWERKIILKSQTYNDSGVQINVLSPSRNQLKRLLEEYKEVTGDSAYTSGKGSDWNTPLKSFIEEGKNFTFSQDSSVKNGSSISFIISISGKSFLFLADSHPNEVIKSLKSLGYSKENPLKVDAMTVAHHGSKSNTSGKLLELIETNNYLISTDSTGHNHPHKQTLARIVNRTPNAILHFNYQYVKEKIMLEQDFTDFPKMKIRLTPKLVF